MIYNYRANIQNKQMTTPINNETYQPENKRQKISDTSSRKYLIFVGQNHSDPACKNYLERLIQKISNHSETIILLAEGVPRYLCLKRQNSNSKITVIGWEKMHLLEQHRSALQQSTALRQEIRTLQNLPQEQQSEEVQEKVQQLQKDLTETSEQASLLCSQREAPIYETLETLESFSPEASFIVTSGDTHAHHWKNSYEAGAIFPVGNKPNFLLYSETLGKRPSIELETSQNTQEWRKGKPMTTYLKENNIPDSLQKEILDPKSELIQGPYSLRPLKKGLNDYPT